MREFFARLCTSLPSFRSFPYFRGESYIGLAGAILWISAHLSLATARRPGFPPWRSRAHDPGNRVRCQAMTVAGLDNDQRVRFLNYFVASDLIVTDLIGLGTPREVAGSHIGHNSPKPPVPHSPFRLYGHRSPWTKWDRSVILSSQDTMEKGQ